MKYRIWSDGSVTIKKTGKMIHLTTEELKELAFLDFANSLDKQKTTEESDERQSEQKPKR